MRRILRRVIAIGLIGLVSSTCLYVSLTFVFLYDLTCWEASHLPRFVLEADADFKFPANAQAVQMTATSGRYWCVISVAFQMPASELDEFLATTQVDALTPNDLPKWFNDYSHEMAKLDVNPDAMKSYLFGRQELSFLNYQTILVDTSNPDTYTVFLVTDQGSLD